AQLGIHAKPIGLLNVNGFYDGLRAFVGHQVAEGFVRPEHEDLMIADSDPDQLIQRLRAVVPVVLESSLPAAAADELKG
ncbi:MAG: TIGR00730 family Rossman fold protein, partial [Oxalobacteraceae bacterium]